MSLQRNVNSFEIVYICILQFAHFLGYNLIFRIVTYFIVILLWDEIELRFETSLDDKSTMTLKILYFSDNLSWFLDLYLIIRIYSNDSSHYIIINQINTYYISIASEQSTSRSISVFFLFVDEHYKKIIFLLSSRCNRRSFELVNKSLIQITS